MQADLAKVELKLLHSELEAAEYLRQIGRLEARLRPVVRQPVVAVERVAALGHQHGPSGRAQPWAARNPPCSPAPPHRRNPWNPNLPSLSLRERAILHRLQRRG